MRTPVHFFPGVLFALTILTHSPLQGQNVVINEIMASNSTILADEDGDYSDWIELYNSGDQAADVTGYGLSDDRNEPLKWTFPAIRLAPRAFLVVFASDKDRRNWLAWQTIIDQGDRWKYWPGRLEPLANWRSIGFDDAQWSEGQSGFGYGDDDDATIVATTPSLYLRKKFMLSDAEDVAEALLHVDYDDGFVAYLNDVEVARSNLGYPGDHPAFNQSTHTFYEAQMYQGGLPEQFVISDFRSALQTGENLLSIQVHNYGTQSTDLTLIPFFSLGFKTAEPDGEYQVADILRNFLPNLHTNFKIASSGELLLLSDPGGKIIDQVESGYLSSDISRGRLPDGSASWFVFSQPSPASANIAPGYQRFVESPQFSPESGFYAAVELTLQPGLAGDKIYYTLDGAEPTEASQLYSTSFMLQRTTVVRARAFAEGSLPSPIVTQTYFINEKFTLPIVSLTTNPSNLWDEETGIYMKGPNAEPENPYFGANFWQEWERPVHVEFFESSGIPDYSFDAGVQIYGAWSRAFSQKSMAIYARGKYGASEIKYRIFPDLPFDSFQNFVLRNSGNDWIYTLFRDGLMQNLVKDSHIDVQAYRPAIVYLNGDYWGILNLREKINEHYLASHWDVDPNKIDLLENNALIIEGDNEHYLAMLNFMEKNDLKQQDNYQHILTMMDLDNYLDYMVAQMYFCNTDWPGNNVKFWRPATQTGKWRWILFDTDFGFGLYNPNDYLFDMIVFATRADGPDWPNPPWSTFILRKLLGNDLFRIDFLNRCADHLNTTFKVARVHQQIDAMKAQLKPEIARHQTRWDGNPTNWDANIQAMKNFASHRQSHFRAHLLKYFYLESMVLVTLDVSNPNAGKIKLNSLTLGEFPWQGNYFKNVPIRLTAIPEKGFKFAGWSDTTLPDSQTVTLALRENVKLTALFTESSSEMSSVIINEIMYKAPDNADAGDWVELYNPNDAPVDLSAWIIKDDDDDHQFILPVGSVLDADSFMVLSNDTLAFACFHPAIKNYLGQIDFGLGRGDQARLFDSNGQLIDSVSYDSKAPWPTGPDGTGASLELKDPGQDNSMAENWFASTKSGGTPGAENSITTGIRQSITRIREFYLAQNYPNPFNTSTLIRYALVVDGRVTLHIYNVRGELVRILIDGIQSGAEHQVLWDGKDEKGRSVSSGIYFYRLQSFNLRETRRMIFLR